MNIPANVERVISEGGWVKAVASWHWLREYPGKGLRMGLWWWPEDSKSEVIIDQMDTIEAMILGQNEKERIGRLLA